MNTRSFTIAAFLLGLAGGLRHAQVLSEQKISSTSGGFTGAPVASTQFGRSMASLGDFDGDGIGDVAVGSLIGTFGFGSVWLLYLNADGTVKENHELVNFATRHVGGLLPSAGAAVASLGDHDGDGVCDLIVGSPGADSVGVDAGAAFVVFLNRDGTAKAQVLITEGQGGFTGDLRADDEFGRDVGFLGDVDGDGIGDVVVGAPRADGRTISSPGAVFVCFLNREGTVRSHVKISEGLAGFTGSLGAVDFFGHGCGGIGDLDGDSILDLAVGARGDDDGGSAIGSLWILFLRSTGQVRSSQKIGLGTGGFHGDLEAGDSFGADVVPLGDLDGDGVLDVGVSTFSDDDGGLGRGSFWILHMRRDGFVRAHHKVSQTQGGFGGTLRDGDTLGLGLTRLADINGDGTPDLAAGAPGTDDGANFAGALWILFMDGVALRSIAEYRNAGTNPESYRTWGNYAGNPVMGGTVELTVDLALTGHQRATVLGFMGQASTIIGRGQALLVDVTHPVGELLHLPLLTAPVEYRATIPVDSSLCGMTLSTQAVHLLGVQPFLLSNAIDFTICN